MINFLDDHGLLQAGIFLVHLDLLASLERLARREIKELMDNLLKVQVELMENLAPLDRQDRSVRTS